MRLLLIFLTTLLLPPLLSAQESVLDRYIQTALESNIALKRRELSYRKSLIALQRAKDRYLPTLSLEARYSVAKGGRAFNIPIGDLVNPVYNNLNAINNIGEEQFPGYPDFPTYPEIENEQVNFLRETEHETKLRVAFPVFNTAILRGQDVQEDLTAAERMSVDIYKRELVKEVKTGYYNYLKAVEGVSLFENALRQVEENLRTTESLHRNHQLTMDQVYSARAQLREVEQQLAEARKDERVARAYFNFLLNRPSNSGIEAVEAPPSEAALLSLEEAQSRARREREEFRQLDHYLDAAEDRLRLERGNYLPDVNLVADYGFQGQTYTFTGEFDFAMGSVLLSWDLFNRTNRTKVQEAEIEQQELFKREEETQRQINLQVLEQHYELQAKRERIDRAQAEVEAAQSAFRLVNKRYEQNQANQVEFINARTQLTNARQRLIIARFDYQVQLAEYERATASYELP